METSKAKKKKQLILPQGGTYTDSKTRAVSKSTSNRTAAPGPVSATVSADGLQSDVLLKPSSGNDAPKGTGQSLKLQNIPKNPHSSPHPRRNVSKEPESTLAKAKKHRHKKAEKARGAAITQSEPLSSSENSSGSAPSSHRQKRKRERSTKRNRERGHRTAKVQKTPPIADGMQENSHFEKRTRQKGIAMAANNDVTRNDSSDSSNTTDSSSDEEAPVKKRKRHEEPEHLEGNQEGNQQKRKHGLTGRSKLPLDYRHSILSQSFCLLISC